MFSKAKALGFLIWKPFDAHFSNVLERFRFHEKQFILEMKTTSEIEALKFCAMWEEKVVQMGERFDKCFDAEML